GRRTVPDTVRWSSPGRTGSAGGTRVSAIWSGASAGRSAPATTYGALPAALTRTRYTRVTGWLLPSGSCRLTTTPTPWSLAAVLPAVRLTRGPTYRWTNVTAVRAASVSSGCLPVATSRSADQYPSARLTYGQTVRMSRTPDSDGRVRAGPVPVRMVREGDGFWAGPVASVITGRAGLTSRSTAGTATAALATPAAVATTSTGRSQDSRRRRPATRSRIRTRPSPRGGVRSASPRRAFRSRSASSWSSSGPIASPRPGCRPPRPSPGTRAPSPRPG